MKFSISNYKLIFGRKVLLAGISFIAFVEPTNLVAQTVAKAGPAEPEEVTVIAPALRVSPSNIPLTALQPTSLIPEGFIRNNLIPLASIDDIVKFQPSIWSQNPNGPGIGKAETIAMRGFQDGQYNMTFDGIPFGDATDLHHTTSSLFIAHDLGEAQIDRGPGTASTIGKATFGGTIGFRTKSVSDSFGLAPYGTYGSFNTEAGGLEIDSGNTQIGRAFIDAQHEQTDGYLTGSNERRTNVLAKGEFDLTQKTKITLVGTYNKEFQYTTQGATLDEYAQNGNNYGLCRNQKLQCFYAYQPSSYYSDFEYVKLSTELSKIRFEDTLYTDGFGHFYQESKDATDNNPADNGVTFYNPITLKKIATFANDISGKYVRASWRSIGNIARASTDLPFGELLAGIWFDQQHDGRYSLATDLSQNGIGVPAKNGSPYTYYFKNVGTTVQPYLELDWKPVEDLLIAPGLKYTIFQRDLNAIVNKTTKVPLVTSVSYESPQPSIAMNYAIKQDWTAYAQIAKGFLAPPVTVLQVNQVSQVNPEETLNYQIGTTVLRDSWKGTLDYYYIDFSNYLASSQVPGSTDSTYVNGGGAIYQGVELEGQYAVGYGLSVYGNYTYNSAQYKGTTVQIAEAPEWTAALGILYDDSKGPYFSVLGKMIGPRYGQDNTSNGITTIFADAYRIKTTGSVDFAGGWRFRDLSSNFKFLSVSVKVANVLNSHAVTDFAGNQAATSPAFPNGAPAYWRAAGRSFFLNVETKFF